MNWTRDKYVELTREFIEIDPDQHDLDELRELVSYGGFYGSAATWEELWQSQAVVILAEAGAGKTTELKSQADQLEKSGKAAFFLPIEELADGDLDKALRIGDEDRFDEWLASQEVGYFLLDSVDETRLVNKSFESAIKTLARRLGAAFVRCKFVITCRFNDWRWHVDQDTVTSVLPKTSLPDQETLAIEPTDDGLLDPIFAKKEGNYPPDLDDNDTDPPRVYRLVALAPLRQNQWRIFAQARGVQLIEPFIQAIFDGNSEDSASRPLDLDRLIRYWRKFHELGTLSERLKHDAEIRLLESNPQYQARHELTPARALVGTETLAAALTLCGFRSIRLPASSTDTQVRDESLDPRIVLNDWGDPELGALLHRAMFHGTSYGCVGFHHRNMQPYFAAKFLYSMSKISLSTRRLRALLIGDLADTSILRPSMTSIAAWLSSWEPRVHQWLLAISPETLMAEGDPETLSDHQCNEVLAAFCSKYAGRTDTGVWLYREQALRLARPSMAPVIRRLWQKNAQYEDQRHLLLRIIEHGPIAECVDFAIESAQEQRNPIATREHALRAVAAAGSDGQKRELMNALLAAIEGMDSRIAGLMVKLFYPAVLTAEDLHRIVELAGPAIEGVWQNDVRHAVETLVKSVDNNTALTFIHRWRPLLSVPPHIESIRVELSQRYLWLLQSLATLCQQLLTTERPVLDDFTASVVETITRAKQYRIDYYGRDIPDLREVIASEPRLNAFFFRRSVRRESAKQGKPITDWWDARKYGDSWALGKADVGWLTDTLCDSTDPADQRIALSALVALHSFWEEDAAMKGLVFAAAASSNLIDDLTEAVRQASAPSKMMKEDERYRRKAIKNEEKDKQSAIMARIQRPPRAEPRAAQRPLQSEHGRRFLGSVQLRKMAQESSTRRQLVGS